MSRFRMELEGGTLGLTASGGIYRSPASPRDTPVLGRVVMRATLPYLGVLDPGDYEYRYEMQFGEGSYVLSLFLDDEMTPVAKSETFDAADQVGNIWTFTVPDGSAGGAP